MKRFFKILSRRKASFLHELRVRRSPLLLLLMGSFFFGVSVFYWQVPAQAAFYKYVDKNGNVHFTDRLESIPEEYRNQMKVYREEVRPETPSSPAKEESQGSAAKLGETEQKGKEAEAKALQDNAAKEERLKAREAKEKSIAELQAQIRAKQEEQRSLRTTWMVYDRVKLNQLNEQISALEKEIESIQKELTEE